MREEKILIDYSKVNEAINYYNRLGFKYIPVPWIVSDEAFSITKDLRTFENNNNVNVASGEQSFLQLVLRGKLKEGRYQCCTAYNTGSEWYMRVELFDFIGYKLLNMDKQRERVNNVANISQSLFSEYTDTKKKTKAGYIEIECNGEIIGKYGYREYNGFSWIYGTGLDEPKFSETLKDSECFLNNILDKRYQTSRNFFEI